MLHRIFKFVEKEDVAFAIELNGGRDFRMDSRKHETWVEIEDADSCCKIQFNGNRISQSEAMLLADEMSEDIAEANRFPK
jgi:hypothetical protein